MFTRQAALLQTSLRQASDLPTAQDAVAALCNCGQPLTHRGPVSFAFDAPPPQAALSFGSGGSGASLTPPPEAPQVPPAEVPNIPPVIIDFPPFEPLRWDSLPFIDVPGGTALLGQPGLPPGGLATQQSPEFYPRPALTSAPLIDSPNPLSPTGPPPAGSGGFLPAPRYITNINGAPAGQFSPGSIASAFAYQPSAVNIQGPMQADSIRAEAVSAPQVSTAQLYNAGPMVTEGASFNRGDVITSGELTQEGPATFLDEVNFEGPVNIDGPVENRGPVTNIGPQINAGPQQNLAPVQFEDRVVHAGPVENQGPVENHGPVNHLSNVNFRREVVHNAPAIFQGGANFNQQVNHAGPVVFNNNVIFAGGGLGQLQLNDLAVVTDITLQVNQGNIELNYTTKTLSAFLNPNQAGVQVQRQIAAARTTQVVTDVEYAAGTFSKSTRDITFFGAAVPAAVDEDVFTANGASFDSDNCEITTDNGGSAQYTPISAA